MINFVKILSNNDNINNRFKKISKFDNYRLYIINIILNAYDKGLNIFNNINNESIYKLNKIIYDTNNNIFKITKYFKYSNNIKIYHWFNLNDIDSLFKL